MTSITCARGWSGLPTSGGCAGSAVDGEGIWELGGHMTRSGGGLEPAKVPSFLLYDRFQKMDPLILFLFLSGGVAPYATPYGIQSIAQTQRKAKYSLLLQFLADIKTERTETTVTTINRRRELAKGGVVFETF